MPVFPVLNDLPQSVQVKCIDGGTDILDQSASEPIICHRCLLSLTNKITIPDEMVHSWEDTIL